MNAAFAAPEILMAGGLLARVETDGHRSCQQLPVTAQAGRELCSGLLNNELRCARSALDTPTLPRHGGFYEKRN